MLVLGLVMMATALLGIVGVAVLEGRQRLKDAAKEEQLRRLRVTGIVHEPSESRRMAELQKRVRARAQERIVSEPQEGQAA